MEKVIINLSELLDEESFERLKDLSRESGESDICSFVVKKVLNLNSDDESDKKIDAAGVDFKDEETGI